jgi:tRNA pseudouridine55 synthase
MESPGVYAVWKPQGWTPLQAVHAFKKSNPKHASETISYAGRLDPMAEGVLLLLMGEENKRRKQYEGLKKEYETYMVLGITTDSLDALGMVTAIRFRTVTPHELASAIVQFVGKQQQAYPAYSSRTVGGKPLYWWARRNRLSEISIPRKTVEIYSIVMINHDMVSVTDLHHEINQKISHVTGDFRQREISAAWETLSKKYADQQVTRVRISISCSSGTYVRQLVSDIGSTIGCGAFALSIVRTKVGQYPHGNCVRFAPIA